ncbi:MAG: Dabb family protein [Loktanella sp.]|nr:Dabb family protein [Loktanella sp.]
MGMILHCVFYHFRQEAATQQRQEIVQELARFSQSLDGVLGFEHGPNRDFEKKSQGYDSGFVIRFTSQEALATYANHPTHQALGKRLCDLVQGGADGIIVFDLETNG